MVLVWTGISYIPGDSVPEGIPRRVLSPTPWARGALDHWTIIMVRSYRKCIWESSQLDLMYGR